MKSIPGPRVESGDTSQKCHFDANPNQASNITVYQKRGGGSWTLKSSAAIAEDDTTHAPGGYSMTMNQDMTITSGKTVEQLVYRLSGAGIETTYIYCEIYFNLKSDQRAVLGNPLVVGGSPPASPIGF